MAGREHAIGVAVAAIAREPDLLLDAGEGLGLLALEQGGRRRHQRRGGEVGGRARPQLLRPARSFIARLAPVAGIALAREGLVHHAVDRHAIARQPDQRAPNRDARDEGARAVDRIEHPDIFRVGVLAAEFLAEHAMGRELPLDHVAHHRFAGAVAFGHGIEHPAPRLVLRRMQRPEEGQDRPAGLRRQLRDESAEIDCAHE